MANYLVTGGAGFIGANLVAALAAQGHHVRVLDDFSTGRRENIERLSGTIELLAGDLRSPETCAAACDDIEVVFHHGAVPMIHALADPVGSHQANIDGTFNILEAARAANCRRVVYAGSSSVYGDAGRSAQHEGSIPAPTCPYSMQKLVGELYCRLYFEHFGMETIVLRYFNVFGPLQTPQRLFTAAIPAFIIAMLSNSAPIVQGDGEQTRDFTYVENVVLANFLAAETARATGQVINIGCGVRLSLNEVVARINSYLGTATSPQYVPARRSDVRHRRADGTQARSALGFKPRIHFDEGLRKTIDWWATREAPRGERPECGEARL